MAFRLRKDARTWFERISDRLPVDFDMYYFCLMAGFAAGRKASVQSNDATDLTQDFPGDYRSRGRIIVAMLLTREIRQLGIRFEERATLHKEISKLIDPLSSTHLSLVGMEAMNQYSFGGFDVLSEWFDDRPRHLETFLPEFRKHMIKAVKSESDT